MYAFNNTHPLLVSNTLQSNRLISLVSFCCEQTVSVLFTFFNACFELCLYICTYVSTTEVMLPPNARVRAECHVNNEQRVKSPTTSTVQLKNNVEFIYFILSAAALVFLSTHKKKYATTIVGFYFFEFPMHHHQTRCVGN